MPGVRRNYWADAQILEQNTQYRECFIRWRIAQRNAANIRLRKALLAGQIRHHTRVHRPCEQTKYDTNGC